MRRSTAQRAGLGGREGLEGRQLWQPAALGGQHCILPTHRIAYLSCLLLPPIMLFPPTSPPPFSLTLLTSPPIPSLPRSPPAGVGILDQQNSFLGKVLLHVAVFGILLVRTTSDWGKYKGLVDEATFYDKQWNATWEGQERPSDASK